jgi:flagellar motor switch/type III secretory pathway protein FliN
MPRKSLLPHFLLLWAGLVGGGALAQDRIYRCGNEYTNMPTRAQEKSCTLITTGSKPAVPVEKGKANQGARPSVRQDAPAQRAKDLESRTILEAELKKAQSQLTVIKQEYNAGEPEKQGSESRDSQKYMDRKADLKARLDRTEADIASLRREIARLPGGVASTP